MRPRGASRAPPASARPGSSDANVVAPASSAYSRKLVFAAARDRRSIRASAGMRRSARDRLAALAGEGLDLPTFWREATTPSRAPSRTTRRPAGSRSTPRRCSSRATTSPSCRSSRPSGLRRSTTRTTSTASRASRGPSAASRRTLARRAAGRRLGRRDQASSVSARRGGSRGPDRRGTRRRRRGRGVTSALARRSVDHASRRLARCRRRAACGRDHGARTPRQDHAFAHCRVRLDRPGGRGDATRSPRGLDGRDPERSLRRDAHGAAAPEERVREDRRSHPT